MSSIASIPEFKSLDTLSLAYNDLTDLDELVETIQERVIKFHVYVFIYSA